MKASAVKYVKAIVNLLLLLTVILLTIWLAPKLIVFFMPFIIGWIIAWVSSPMVKFFEDKLKIKRKAGSAVVIIVVIGLVVLCFYFIGARLVRELMDFVKDFPVMWEGLKKDFEEIYQNLSKILPKDMQSVVQTVGAKTNELAMSLVEKFSAPAIDWVSSVAKQIPTIIIAVIMCLLSAYFFVAERSIWSIPVKKMIPRGIYSRLSLVAGSIKKSVGGYIKAQLKIEVWIYLLLEIGLLILGVSNVLIVGLGIAFLDFFPFFGTGTVMVPWAIIKFLSGDYMMAAGILIVWGISQLVRQFIQPKIMGDSMGMPPIPTLVFLYVGYKLGGVIGMILALPIALVIETMYKEGVFDTTQKSLQILATGINRFRKITDEDMQEVEAYQAKEQQKEQE